MVGLVVFVVVVTGASVYLTCVVENLGPVSQKILRAIVIIYIYQAQKCPSEKS